MKPSASILILSLLASSNPGAAEPYQVMGLGAQSCQIFLQDYSRNPKVWEEAYFNWAQGWISGVNSVNLDKFRDQLSISSAEQRQLIRDYCRKNPSKRYLFAVAEVYRRLSAVKAAQR